MYVPTSWCERLVKVSAHDFSTIEGLKEYVQDSLELPGYGVDYRLYHGDQILDEAQARDILLQAVITSPELQRYFNQVSKVFARQERPDWSTVSIEYSNGQLIFDHADIFQMPVKLDPTITVRSRGVASPQRQRVLDERQEQQREKLQSKLEATTQTDEMTYMQHANQCGYLLKNTSFRVYHFSKMWGLGLMTHIRNTTIDQLHEMVDSAGRNSLAGISPFTEIDPSESQMSVREGDIMATHRNFAREVVDFLNLEFIVDVDQILSEWNVASKGDIIDSGFRSLERWGADRSAVISRLQERRKDFNSQDIEEYFTAGYEGTLV